MRLTYKYRLYPSKKQKKKLFEQFDICCKLHNEMLSISSDAYKYGKISFGKKDMHSYVKGQYKQIYSQVKQDVGNRLSKAFDNFFTKLKKKIRKKGYPRHKSRVQSITYTQKGFTILSDKSLQVSKIGNIGIVLHRVPKGKIKTLTIKKNKLGQWFAFFSCEIKEQKINHPFKEVGVDVGLINYAALSIGEKIDNPRWLRKSEKKLKLLQRRVSRKKLGSMNRRKAKYKLRKQHLKVANQREDFIHKFSRRLSSTYEKISFENLDIKKMLQNHKYAKSISDAAWNKLFQFTSYKAITGGGEVKWKEPRNTSKTCRICGTIIDMKISDRIFLCPNCSHCEDRDVNAAHNIMNKVGTDCAELNACGDITSTASLKCVVASNIVEAGTICNRGFQFQ